MSEYPIMLYHSDGRSAVASTAHEEKNSFAGWSRKPFESHLKDPPGGRGQLSSPTAPPLEDTGFTHGVYMEPAGPVDAGTVRQIIRREMQEHPGFSIDMSALAHAVADIVIERLMAAQPPSEPETSDEEPGGDTPEEPKRRGRPPGVRTREGDA